MRSCLGLECPRNWLLPSRLPARGVRFHVSCSCIFEICVWLCDSVPSCVEPVNRLGLHHYSTTPQPLSVGQQDRVVASRMFTSDLLQSTLLCYEKVRVLEEGWPKVMRKLIQEAMEEYKNMDDNMATLLQQL